MEKMSHPTPAYLVIDENEFAFSDKGEITFRVFPKGEALTSGNVFIVDIYAADDHSHPNGHAGWWEYPLTGNTSVDVRVTYSEKGLTVFFNGESTQTFWQNDKFHIAGRTLIMHLVVREWRSTTILFNDPISVYPDQKTLEASKPGINPGDLPDDIPLRWFIWPAQQMVKIVFGSLNSKGSQTLCRQLSVLLNKNNITFRIYAHEYSNIQRKSVQPVEYLCHDAKKEDLIFFVLAEGGPALSIVANLSCKKILYHMHLPDYRRYQAFDAEFARKLEELADQQHLIMKFDGICYESEYTKKLVTQSLYKQASLSLLEEWGACQTPDGIVAISPIDIYDKNSNSPKCSTETLFCTLPKGSPEFLPQRLALTIAKPDIPQSLGSFPPSLWRKNWEKVSEDECQTPEMFILSVGSFRPDRHHETTLQIFAEIAKQHPSLGLVIAGWPFINGYWDYLRFLRENIYSQYASRIVFLQSCNEGQLKYLYKRAKLFFSASSYEGYSGSIADALTFDLPIVARQTKSTKKILSFSGLQFFEGINNASIAEDIIRISIDASFRDAIIFDQRKFARGISATGSAKTILSTIQQSLPRTPVRT